MHLRCCNAIIQQFVLHSTQHVRGLYRMCKADSACVTSRMHPRPGSSGHRDDVLIYGMNSIRLFINLNCSSSSFLTNDAALHCHGAARTVAALACEQRPGLDRTSAARRHHHVFLGTADVRGCFQQAVDVGKEPQQASKHASKQG